MIKSLTPDFLCCELSEEMNEPMIGTAVTTSVWFMLEYTRPWQAKATIDNELSSKVMSWLNDAAEKFDGRLQFIRQFRADADVLTFFIGVNDETNPRLYEFHLGAYDDLFELDVTAIVAGDGRYQPHVVTGQRIFVCTNGKRDRSCAIYGAALYRALAEKTPASVWMTTHLGGHRFAATLLSLPDGVCYGRVKPENIKTWLQAVLRNELKLETMRGRTCYQPIAQIADVHLRQQTAQTRLDAFTLTGTEAMGDGRWQVQFKDGAGKTHAVILEEGELLSVYANSGSSTLKEVPQYTLVDIK